MAFSPDWQRRGSKLMSRGKNSETNAASTEADGLKHAAGPVTNDEVSNGKACRSAPRTAGKLSRRCAAFTETR
jgi:hypothetical protein